MTNAFSLPASHPERARVLVVEDEAIVALDIGRQLDVLDYELVAQTGRGEEALLLVEQHRPDLVLMDISLAGAMDGITAARAIRDRFALPVVFLTALTDRETLERAREAEPFGYIIKPFDERDLHVVIEIALYKHRSEARLRESEEMFAKAFQTAPYAITITRLEDGRFVEVNQNFTAISGFSREEALSSTATALELWVHEEDRQLIKQELCAGRTAAEREFLFRRKDGAVITGLVSAQLIQLGGERCLIASINDITERKRGEENLRHSQAQMRALTAHLQTVREQERTGLARELHDELAQTLTLMKMDLYWLERQLGKSGLPGATALGARVLEMNQIADTAIQCVQRIATGLRPAVLDSLGLSAAIEWQTNEFQTRSGIPCRIDVPEEEPNINRDMATATFRILQESLTNIARHATAQHVEVSLGHNAAGLVLRVADDGRGIQPEEIDNPMSIGLVGMRERAQMLGGTVEIKPKSGGGTVVEMRLPVQPDYPPGETGT